MKARSFLFANMLLIVFGFMVASCAGTTTPSVAEPTATPDYRAFIQAAQSAYQAGDFTSALQEAQSAVKAAPMDATSWEWVRRAAVAEAAEDYLRGLPADRYRVSPAEYLANVANGQLYVVLDVREPDEFAAGHIEGAVNVPMRELAGHLDALPSNTSTPILVYCHSGKRSTHVLVVLHELGFSRASNLDGGYAAFEEYIATHQLPTPGPTPTRDPASDPDHDGGC